MSEQKLGHLVAIEGHDCTGKTTQRELLIARLEAAGYEVVTVREPGGTERGEVLREMLKYQGDRPLTPLQELLLASAARDELYASVIAPALAEGKVVVVDRSYFSTYAYQVHPHVEQQPMLLQLFNMITGQNCAHFQTTPFIMVNLELDEETRRVRATACGEPDTIEQRGPEYQAKVAEAYQLLGQQPGVLSFNAAQDADALADQIYDQLMVQFNAQVVHAEQRRQHLAEVEATQATQAEAEPQAEPEAPKPVTVDALHAMLLRELNVHSEKLMELYTGDKTRFQEQWDKHQANICAWLELFIEEQREKAPEMPEAAAMQTVNMVAGNIGQMLGSFLTLVNIEEMVTLKAQLKAEQPDEGKAVNIELDPADPVPETTVAVLQEAVAEAQKADSLADLAS